MMQKMLILHSIKVYWVPIAHCIVINLKPLTNFTEQYKYIIILKKFLMILTSLQ